MKRFAGKVTALSLLLTSGHVVADVFYSGLQNTTIPTTYGGVNIDVDGVGGWDLNPFLGGFYLYNNSSFQPARSGTGGLNTVLNFSSGTVIDSSLNYATGTGGSLDHLGPQFTAGSEGYLGFKLNGTDYGWMRVVFTNNNTGALIKDWGYNTGGSIAVGNVLQSGSVFTLDSSVLSFALGSAITGANSVVKNGANTVTLKANSSYTGGTTVNAGMLELAHNNAAGTGGITLTGATELDLKINSGITIANDITFSNTNANSSVIRQVAASNAGTDDDYTTGTSGVLKSSFAGGKPDTTARILEGTNSGAATSLIMGFRDTADPLTTNDGARRTDIFNITGTTVMDSFVVQLTVSGLASDSRLAFWNSNTSAWSYAGLNFFANAWVTGTYVAGDYGFDSSTGSAWAVVNGTFSGFTGSFTVIPEPTSALGGLLLTAGLLRRRRQGYDGQGRRRSRSSSGLESSSLEY